MKRLLTLWRKNPLVRIAHRFIEKRTPKSDRLRLGLNNVYVFFSRQGFLFAALLCLTFVVGVNYANNLVLGLFFYLFGVWLIGVFYTFLQVSSLDIKLVQTQMTQAQSLCWVTLEISVRSGKPSHQVRLYFAGSPKETQQEQTITLTAVSSPTLVKVPVYAAKRGVMTLPRLVIESVYPLGVMKAWAYGYFDSQALIYPKPERFVWQETQRQTAHQDDAEYGHASTVGQNDFDRLDEYQQGESLTRVSWTHLARGAGMLTKHFANPVSGHVHLAYVDMPSTHHEQKLSELCFAILQLQESGQPFTLTLASGASQTGVGDEFVRSCLMLLAKEP